MMFSSVITFSITFLIWLKKGGKKQALHDIQNETLHVDINRAEYFQ